MKIVETQGHHESKSPQCHARWGDSKKDDMPMVCVLLVSIKVTKLHHLLLDPLLTECSKRQSMEVEKVSLYSFEFHAKDPSVFFLQVVPLGATHTNEAIPERHVRSQTGSLTSLDRLHIQWEERMNSQQVGYVSFPEL